MIFRRPPASILRALQLLVCFAPFVLGVESALEQGRLYGLLDLDKKGLEQVRQCVSAGDMPAATRALTEHFKGRFPKSTIKPKIINNVAVDADEALKFRFRGRSSPEYFELHRDFEWKTGPAGVADHHWLSLFVSLDVLGFLSDMYIKTGDEKYAAGCMKVFEDWAKHCPPGSGAPSWSLATTMMRLGVMLRVFERMVQWPGWPPEAEARFLNSIHDHADMMFEHRGKGNQDSTNSEHLMRVAGALPEFKDCGKWFDAGFERVKDRIFEDTLEDGAQKELCSGYHLNAITGYTNAAKALKAVGRSVSADYMKRLEKMYEWCMVMIRPDGSVPTSGDSVGGGMTEYLEEGAALFGRSDMTYVASKGASGTEPGFMDASLPVAGYYVMRSGWKSKMDLYFFMDISRQPVVSHQYFDALHMDLYAYGRDFFPDIGTFSYGGAAHKQSKATINHTTIAIDEANQGDVPSVCNAVFSSPVLSFLDGSQAGYKDITHRRQVLFVRPADSVLPYFVLIDRVAGTGRHIIDQNFHFMMGEVSGEPGKAMVRTGFKNGGNLFMSQLSENGIVTQIAESELHPRQGETEKRPYVRFRREAELPVTFVTLLFPYQGATPPSVDARLIDRKSSKDIPDAADIIAVRVAQGAACDLLFAAGGSPSADGQQGGGGARGGLIRSIGKAEPRIIFVK